MVGFMSDVSPRSFFRSQVSKDLRIKWDASLKEMDPINSKGTSSKSYYALRTDEDSSEDMIYYRTKWPWPLKDRDYTLVRR